MRNEITTQTYWENYYAKTGISRERIIHIGSQYKDLWSKFLEESRNSDKSIIEIGTFPGRYMAYLSSEYGLKASGIDFNSDKEKIQATMKAMGVEDFIYFNENFLTFSPEQKYDYVLSLGFIEHFENYEEVMDLHCNYLKQGGRLMFIIPNKRYFRKFYGYLCDYENLKAHNLKCMNLKTFEDFAERNNLQIDHLNYYGEFQYSPHQTLNLIQKIIYKTTKLIFKKINSLIVKYPNRFLSGSIVALYSRPDIYNQ